MNRDSWTISDVAFVHRFAYPEEMARAWKRERGRPDCPRSAARSNGTPISEIIRLMGVTDVTFYRWEKLCANLGLSDISRLKHLEEENHRLGRLESDLALKKQMLQDVLSREQ